MSETGRELLARHILYKTTLLTVTLLSTVAALHVYTSPVLKIFLGWGALLILADLFRGHRFWENRGLMLLIVFCLCYAATVFVNRDTELARNIRAFAYMPVFFFVLYDTVEVSPETLRRERLILGHVLLAGLAGLAAVCLGTALLGYSGTYETAEGLTGFLGLREGRLFGLFNANAGGALYALGLLIAGGLWFGTRPGRHGLHAVYALCLLLFFVCLGLCWSRTSIVAYALSAAFAAFWLAPALGEDAGKKEGSRFGLRFAAALLMLAVTLGGLWAVHRYGMPLLEKRSEMAAAAREASVSEESAAPEGAAEDGTQAPSTAGIAAEGQTGETAEAASAAETAAAETTAAAPKETRPRETNEYGERVVINDSGRTELYLPGYPYAMDAELPHALRVADRLLSGRIEMWKCGLEAFREAPVFGITYEAIPANVIPRMISPGWTSHVENGSLHSIYVTTPVAAGLLGVLPLLLFTLFALIRLLRTKKRWGRFPGRVLPTVLPVLVFILLTELTETRILFRPEFFCAVFWIAAGMAREAVGKP